MEYALVGFFIGIAFITLGNALRDIKNVYFVSNDGFSTESDQKSKY